MQVKCEFCGGYIDEKDETCSHCGAVNGNFKRVVDDTPKTIEQLQAWYMEKNLPPKETTRFFIGENYQGARAFGIYEENGEFIVYKNKDDGSRAIRYQGKDEAYAVNELFLRLKSEILNQKAHNINNGGKAGSKQTKFKETISMLWGAVCVIFVVGAILTTFIQGIKDKPYAGNYYRNGSDVYYCESYVDDDWYLYDYDTRDYLPVSLPAEMHEDIQSYRFYEDEEWDNSLERFEDTEMGQYVESQNSSSDSDYSWSSSDSWDSDSSDWGSDW